ncbi:hypothetical protein KA977_13420, partial [Candidatus Dependentiae bacterium]|nr:hypothetical protein [Candidatus Dependentiae bacterium]
MYYHGNINGWSADSMIKTGGIWKKTLQAAVSEASIFKIANTNNWTGIDWSTGGVLSFNVAATFFQSNGGNTTINTVATRYYTFSIADNDGGNVSGAVLETIDSPVTITSVQRSSDLFSDTGVRITVTLNSNLSSGETVYIRYTTDNWGSSAVVGMKGGSGNNWYTDIPKQKSGITVIYYAATSTVSLTDFQNNADLLTINLDNNSGSNYTYTQDYVRITGSLIGGWLSSDSIIYQGTSWPNNCLYRTIRVSSSADSSFKFVKGTSADDWRYQWGGTTAADIDSSVTKNSVINIIYSDGVTRDKLLLNGVTAGKYYTCKLDTSANKAAVLETSNPPISILSVTSVGTIGSNETASVTITLSGSKSPEEKILLVYTSDNWLNTYSVEASVSGANCTAVIPGFTAGTAVKYYVTSTTLDTNTYNSYTQYVEKTLLALSGNNNNGNYYTYNVVNNSIPLITFNSSSKPSGSYFNTNLLNLSLTFSDSSGLNNIWWNINQNDSNSDKRYLIVNSSLTDSTVMFNYPTAGDTLNWTLLTDGTLNTLRFWVNNDGGAVSDSYAFVFYKDITSPVITVNDDSYTIKSEGVNYIGKSFDADFSDNTGIDTVYINLNANTEVLHSGGVTSITEN